MHITKVIQMKDIEPFVEDNILDGKIHTTEINGHNYAFIVDGDNIKLMIDNVIHDPNTTTWGDPSLTEEASKTLKVLYHVLNKKFCICSTETLLIPGREKHMTHNPMLLWFDFNNSPHSIITSRDQKYAYGYFFDKGRSPVMPVLSDRGIPVDYVLDNSTDLKKEHYDILYAMAYRPIFENEDKQKSFKSTVDALLKMILKL